MKNRISPRQFQRMMMIELFSTTSLILPALVVRLSGKKGLAPLFVGSALAVLLAVYYLWVCEDWQYGYEKEVMNCNGKVLSSVYVILYSIRYFIHGLFLMTLFSALIQEVLLPAQSRGLILLPVLLLSFYATRKNLSARARTLELFFYYIFVPLLLVLVLALFQVDYKILPDMLWNGNETKTQPVLAAYGILMTYRAMEFILFLYPVTEEKGDRKRSGMGMGRVCFFVIFLNILIYVITVGMFGTIRTGKKLWSALYIMQNVRLPGHFLERLDILFLAFWIISVFALFSGYLFYSETIVSEWNKKIREERSSNGKWMSKYGTGKWQKYLYPVLFLGGIFCFVLWQPNPEKALSFFARYVMWIDFPLSLILPLIVKLRKTEQIQKIQKVGAMLLLLLSCTLAFTGCESRVDIEDKNYILTLGIDKGKEKALLVTYGEANLNAPTGEGQGGGEQKGKATVYEADSLSEAEAEDSRSDEKRLDYGHLKAILFSKELMADKELWDKVKEELENKSNLAGTVLVFQVDGNAGECIAREKNLSSSLGEYLDKMMTNHKKDGREKYTLGELLRDEAEGRRDRIFPELKMEKDKIVLLN